MSLGLVGRKIGMTRLFTDDGDAVPVTVVDVSNNRVTQIKTPETDGYSAVQLTFGKRRTGRVSKPAAGHFAKAGVEAIEEGRVQPNARILLPAFGAGLTFCAHFVRWGDRVTPRGTTAVDLPPCERTALEMVREQMRKRETTSVSH